MSAKANLKAYLRRMEADYISNALRRSSGNVAAAARDLDLPLATLWWKLERLGIKPEQFRSQGGER